MRSLDVRHFMLSPPAVVAVFDLDRTVTRSGTYTPFLLHCRSLLSPSGFWNFLCGMPTLARYHLGRATRGMLKETMLRYWIAGTSRSQVSAWVHAFTERWLESHIRPGARAAIARHRAEGHHLVLATASLDFYATEFANRLGFDHVIATPSVWDDSGRLCPRLGGENCYGHAKLAAVKAYVGSLPAPMRAVVYSDHYSDLDLLRWASEGVAVNPDMKLRKVAPVHDLVVVDWNKA